MDNNEVKVDIEILSDTYNNVFRKGEVYTVLSNNWLNDNKTLSLKPKNPSYKNGYVYKSNCKIYNPIKINKLIKIELKYNLDFFDVTIPKDTKFELYESVWLEAKNENRPIYNLKYKGLPYSIYHGNFNRLDEVKTIHEVLDLKEDKYKTNDQTIKIVCISSTTGKPTRDSYPLRIIKVGEIHVVNKDLWETTSHLYSTTHTEYVIILDKSYFKIYDENTDNRGIKGAIDFHKFQHKTIDSSTKDYGIPLHKLLDSEINYSNSKTERVGSDRSGVRNILKTFNSIKDEHSYFNSKILDEIGIPSNIFPVDTLQRQRDKLINFGYNYGTIGTAPLPDSIAFSGSINNKSRRYGYTHAQNMLDEYNKYNKKDFVDFFIDTMQSISKPKSNTLNITIPRPIKKQKEIIVHSMNNIKLK